MTGSKMSFMTKNKHRAKVHCNFPGGEGHPERCITGSLCPSSNAQELQGKGPGEGQCQFCEGHGLTKLGKETLLPAGMDPAEK